ncbi:hypothetical protein SAMN05216386_0471 [Nitrosospira briensis]|uniref:Uncharacterized protein n=1 Tax=Nitrosospira briensis TaxID=35799 RepID=A0A1I4Y2C7_9PROT|nr:hypothetical protein [Nitrosospira briensis]SFN32258.1 hypothetical protein SAMN05216386_0471 [Nitrosospira briensis]
MAKGNSSPVVRLAPATSLLKDKFVEANWAICQTSFIAHFLASTISKQLDAGESVTFDNREAEGLLVVLNNLVERIEGSLSLLDECERAANHGD